VAQLPAATTLAALVNAAWTRVTSLRPSQCQLLNAARPPWSSNLAQFYSTPRLPFFCGVCRFHSSTIIHGRLQEVHVPVPCHHHELFGTGASAQHGRRHRRIPAGWTIRTRGKRPPLLPPQAPRGSGHKHKRRVGRLTFLALNTRRPSLRGGTRASHGAGGLKDRAS